MTTDSATTPVTQAEKARLFASLHRKGTPLVLYNIWDAGGARAAAEAGAAAVATGSLSVAAAHGYPDGEHIPLSFLKRIAERIAGAVDLPLTVDFEGAYAVAPDEVAKNVGLIVDAGAVGINLEDQVVGGEGLHAPEVQAERIAAARRAGEARGVDLFVNARTDLFLKETDQSRHGDLMAEAKTRAAAYAEAGGQGFFVPGLVEPALIEDICEASPLPVNILVRPGAPTKAELSGLGVARISHGPGPYFEAMKTLQERAAAAL